MSSNRKAGSACDRQIALFIALLLPVSLVGALATGTRLAAVLEPSGNRAAVVEGAGPRDHAAEEHRALPVESTELSFRLHEGNAQLLQGRDDPEHERWADLVGNYYAAGFARHFSYEDTSVDGPRVWVSVKPQGTTLEGRLEAHRLKPNFVYQIKLSGDFKDRKSFERIGRLGRWRLPGRETNYSDWDYERFPKKELVDAYIFFDFFATDGAGNAVKEFALRDSYHVLKRLSRNKSYALPQDIREVTLEGDIDGLYVRPKAGPLVERVGADREGIRYWQRDRIQLPPGHYTAKFVLTEESFHSRDNDGGWWATPLSVPIEFEIVPPEGAAGTRQTKPCLRLRSQCGGEVTVAAAGLVVEAEVVEDLKQPLLTKPRSVQRRVMVAAEEGKGGLTDKCIVLFGRESFEQPCHGFALGRQDRYHGVGDHGGQTAAAYQCDRRLLQLSSQCESPFPVSL